MEENITIKEIASLCNGKLIGDGSRTVAHFATDSRSLPRTEQVMFVAISGDNHNGNNYLQDVYDKGVRCFLTDQQADKRFSQASFCVVNNALTALQLIAAKRRADFKGQVIAITGSNGKTIIKEWIYQILQSEESVIRSPRSFNSQLGVPLSVWQLTDSYDFGIIEAGISLPGEMIKLQAIICPDIGVLSNIGPAHGENFISNTQKLEEKLLLFRNCKKLIFNRDLQIDNQNIHSFLIDYKCEKVDWSLGGKACYSYKLLNKTEESSDLQLIYEKKSFAFKLPFSDSASVENSLHVITLLLELGLLPERIMAEIGGLEPIEMRLETLNGKNGSTLVSDVYNSDLAGLGVALNVLDQQKKYRRKLVILSDVYQSGMNEHVLYKEVADLLKFRKIDRIFCVGKAISEQDSLFPDSSRFYKDTRDFIENFSINEIENAAVLIKGARKFQFENLTLLLQEQVHKTVLEINVTDLAKNLNYYRSLLNVETKIMVMVKALSYGSGSDEIAGFLQHEKVDYLAVAFPDEGVKLRRAGVYLPIMVMNADVDDYKTLLEHDLEPEIYSREGFEAFVKHSKYMGRTDYPVHIKLDTGMHRLGFEEKDIPWLCENLSKEAVSVQSIFTHLVGSEDATLDAFSDEQVRRFRNMSDRIRKVVGDTIMMHVLNSAGIERFPLYQFDMVRIGIGIYGLGHNTNLNIVSTFKTIISQIRDVKAGDTVGYGRKGQVLKNSRIATIPVGYADGLDRRLGNGRFSFFINGKKVPTVGNICMDMTMIDISDVDATIGDTVELFGKNIPVEELAAQLDTIVYEVLTSLPERVKRVYIRE